MDRLSPDELAYHAHLQQEVQTANEVLAAWHRWLAYLAQRYRLGRADQILPDGALLRLSIPEVLDGDAR